MTRHSHAVNPHASQIVQVHQDWVEMDRVESRPGQNTPTNQSHACLYAGVCASHHQLTHTQALACTPLLSWWGKSDANSPGYALKKPQTHIYCISIYHLEIIQVRFILNGTLFKLFIISTGFCQVILTYICKYKLLVIDTISGIPRGVFRICSCVHSAYLFSTRGCCSFRTLDKFFFPCVRFQKSHQVASLSNRLVLHIHTCSQSDSYNISPLQILSIYEQTKN